MAEVMEKGELKRTFGLRANGRDSFLAMSGVVDLSHIEETGLQDLAESHEVSVPVSVVAEWAEDQGPTYQEIVDKRVFNAGMKDGAEEIGQHDKGNARAEVLQGRKGEDKKEEKRRKFADLLHRLFPDMDDWSVEKHFEELDKLRNWLNKRTTELEKQAADEQKLIESNIERMQANSQFIGEADTILDAYKKGKSVDPETVHRLLKQQGVDVEDGMPLVLLLTKLETARDEAEQQNAELEEENEVHEDNKTKWISEADKYRKTADVLHSKTEDIKAKRDNGEISEEEAKQQLEEIWNGVPKETIDKYEAEYGKLDQKAEQQGQQRNEKDIAREETSGSALLAKFRQKANPPSEDITAEATAEHSAEDTTSEDSDLKDSGPDTKPPGLG